MPLFLPHSAHKIPPLVCVLNIITPPKTYLLKISRWATKFCNSPFKLTRHATHLTIYSTKVSKIINKASIFQVMESPFKTLHAFTLIEMVVVILIVSILISLATSKVFVDSKSICQERLKHSLSLVRSKLTQIQMQQFLTKQTHKKPSLESINKALNFTLPHCHFHTKNEVIHLQINHQESHIFLDKDIENTYVLVCKGVFCSEIGF